MAPGPRVALLRMPPVNKFLSALVSLVLGILCSGASAGNLTVHVQDAKGQALADAVVSAQVEGAAPKLAHGATAQMGQKNRTFVPHILVIQTGTAVNFPNFDTVRHHVYSFSTIKPFELKLYAATPAAPIVFDQPGTAVLGCNIHDQMNAFIHVVSTPYFATTDASGTATLAVPPGELRLQIWHPMLSDTAPPAVQRYKPGDPDAITVVLSAPGAGS